MSAAKLTQPATYLKAILAAIAAAASTAAASGNWWAALAAAVGGFNLVYWPGNAGVKNKTRRDAGAADVATLLLVCILIGVLILLLHGRINS